MRALAPAAALFLLALLAAPLPGAQVAGLYEGEVEVASEQEALRDEALGRALLQVLTKLTGAVEPGGSAVAAARAEPGRYLQQFRYRETGDAAAPLALWARFDPSAVDALVREAGLPVWSAERPGVLAWVALAREGEPEIVAPDAAADDQGVVAAMAARAWRRGVPLSFPLLDLEDRVRIEPADVWQLDDTALAAASARYAPGAVLAGRIERSADGAWLARWRLDEGGRRFEWQGRGSSAADAAAPALDVVAQRFAAHYALAPEQGAPGAIEVRVSGVRTLADYARVLGYLEALDQVQELMVSGARGDEFAFRMQVRGGAEGLRRLASFGGVLAAEPGDGEAVRFRLAP